MFLPETEIVLPMNMSAKISGISRKCPNNWNRTINGSCWRAFYKIQMTWKVAHAFCLQQGGRLANSTYFRVINKNSTILSDGRRYWIKSTEINAHFPKDPLQGWYTSNGRPLKAANWRKTAIYANLQYTDDKERCAFIRDNNGMIYLEDSSCDLPRRSFICKKKKSGDDKVCFVQTYVSNFHCIVTKYKLKKQ
jgi:putative hemolysin